MGSKKKNANKQQENPKGGQANGRHDKAPANSSPKSAKPAQKGADAKQGKPLKPAAQRPPPPSSSSSSSSLVVVPESRLPWRLILLVSILAAGAGVVCVNEPVRSVLEDVYQTHIQPQTHQALSALHQILQGDSASDRPPTKEDPPPPQQQQQAKSNPAESSSGDRQKRDTQDPPPPSPPPAATPVSTPPPPPPRAETKPETSSERRARDGEKADDVRTEKSGNAQGKEKTGKEEKNADRQPKEDVTRENKKEEEQERKPDKAGSPQTTTRQTTEPAKTPTPPESREKPENPTQPVVEGITVKATPKPSQKPSPKPEKPAEKDHHHHHNAPTPQKPQDSNPEKSASKPAGKSDPKSARKDQEESAPASSEKAEGKASGKSDKKDEKTSEERPTSGGTGEKSASQKKSEETGAEKSAGSPRDDYAKAAITNKADYKIRQKLDEAEDLLQQGKIEDALRKFDAILRKHPKSPRAQLGRADTLDQMASLRRSNEILEQCILGYERLLYHGEDVLPELMKTTGRKLAKKQHFRGWGTRAAKTLQFLVERFPEDRSLRRELGVGHLMVGQNEEARRVFQQMLAVNPEDGFAQVHLGFIVKTADNDPEKALPLLKAGIASKEEGTQDGRFFFHLGDAYQRLGHMDKARRVYQQGADIGLFLSADQRSLYNVDTLKSRPWWTRQQTGYQAFLKLLEDNWQTIRDEGLQQLDAKSGFFKPEAESLREKGDWKQLTMYQQGRQNKKVCEKVPKTCALIEKIPDAKGCKRGQVKFSVMQPGVHVWPHCGPTNCRIRAHLGLVVPEGPRIRVVNETRTWKEGKFIIFDDSFEHEVWHDGDSVRMVLIVDFWHPDLTEEQKRTMVPI